MSRLSYSELLHLTRDQGDKEVDSGNHEGSQWESEPVLKIRTIKRKQLMDTMYVN